jgi:DNA-directed RNA polymerase specialized sigma24 family protein
MHQSAYLLCGDWHLAHDLVQDTLVKAYQHWPRIRQADSPDAYVRRILLNEVRGRWRRRERVVPVSRFPDMVNHVDIPAGFRQVAPPQ